MVRMITSTYGFRSAQAAWENANPYDTDCTCLDEDLFICPDCGMDGDREMECEVCRGTIRQVSDDARRQDYPAAMCPMHGYDDEDDSDFDNYLENLRDQR